MRFHYVPLLVMSCCVVARSGQQPSPPAQKPPNLAPQKVEVEQVQPTANPPPVSQTAAESGSMDAAQLKALLHKIWLAEFRVNDLLTQVHPERWKLADAARASFAKTLETLRGELSALDRWREQFEKRPDSMYLGYETYAGIGALLPRIDGVSRSVSQHENPSLGAQYSQAENQLFDLEQALRLYLGYLLRNQDQMLLATQNNLAACQNELGYALRGRAGAAKAVGNTVVGRPVRRRSSRNRTK